MNTMTIRHLFRASALAAACLILSNCETGPSGPVDITNPTIDQMDSLDVQWGLPKRVSKGAPKRYFNGPAPAAAESADKKEKDEEKPTSEPVEPGKLR
jgi:hypothetical protein